MFAAGGIFAGAQLLIIHGFLGGGAVEDLSTTTPDMCSIAYTLPDTRPHYTLADNRPHYVLSEQ